MAIPESPQTRLEMYLDAIAKGSSGGDITVESKTVTANGTVTAPSGKAYSPIIVNVPNSYAAGDNGKVVNNGQLVSQTAHAEVTENGPIDTTLNNSVVVNVQGSASSPWTKLAEQEFEVSTTSTSETTVGTISAPGIYEIVRAKQKYIYVFARDKAGKRNGHYYGNDWYKLNNTYAGQSVYVKSNGALDYASVNYGIYADLISSNDTITIKSKYVSNFGSLDGTFHVEVYALDHPSGVPALYG